MDYAKEVEKMRKQGGKPVGNFGALQGRRGKDDNKKSERKK